MQTEVFGTIEHGTVTLDEALPYPDQTRVRVKVELVAAEPTSQRSIAQAAWERVQQRLEERPLHNGGIKFSRDELYERD